MFNPNHWHFIRCNLIFYMNMINTSFSLESWDFLPHTNGNRCRAKEMWIFWQSFFFLIKYVIIGLCKSGNNMVLLVVRKCKSLSHATVGEMLTQVIAQKLLQFFTLLSYVEFVFNSNPFGIFFNRKQIFKNLGIVLKSSCFFLKAKRDTKS